MTERETAGQTVRAVNGSGTNSQTVKETDTDVPKKTEASYVCMYTQ